MLAIPVNQICNLHINLSHFPHRFKLTFLKPLYKQVLKKILQIFVQPLFDPLFQNL